jgi:hypothetical protein
VLKRLWIEWCWCWQWGIKRIARGQRPAIREAKRFQAQCMLKVATASDEELDLYAARLAALGHGTVEEFRAVLENYRLESTLYPERREEVRKWLDGSG